MPKLAAWRGRPQIEVTFEERAVRAYEDGPGTQLADRTAAEFAAWSSGFHGPATLVRTIPDPGPIERLIAAARARDPAFVPPLWRTWFILSVPVEEDDRLDEHVAAIRRWESVRDVSVLRVAARGPDWVLPLAEGLVLKGGVQGVLYGEPHLGPAARSEADSFAGMPIDLGFAGLDSFYGWRMPGGDGKGTWLALVDNAWNADHTDLPGPKTIEFADGLSNLTGVAYAADRAHGTKAAVTAAGVVNDVGWGMVRTGAVGCAPGTSEVRFASVVRSVGASLNYRHAAAIAAAAGSVPVGSVVLLETQTASFRPIEFGSAQIRESIWLAVKAGRIVVEAAGTSDDKGEQPRLDPPAGTIADSGAIVVSARDASLGNWIPACPWGPRVDCHAWGNYVTTSGEMDSSQSPPLPSPDDKFGGSSAASAIVAGLCLQIQGMRRAHLLRELTSIEMRDLFRTGEFGTSSADGDEYPIGPMPDLMRIVRAHVLDGYEGGLPDLYLRQSPEHDGERYLEGDLGASPDIWIDWRDSLRWAGRSSHPGLPSSGAQTAVTRTLRVRLRNRGIAAARDARVRLWSAPLSPLPDPGAWAFVASQDVAVVAPGSETTLGFSVPAGPRTYVVTWSWAGEDAPGPAEIRDLAGLEWFARALGKVAWRSFPGFFPPASADEPADAPVDTSASSTLVDFLAKLRLDIRGGCPWNTALRLEGPGLAGAEVRATLSDAGAAGARARAAPRLRPLDLRVRKGRATHAALEKLAPGERDRAVDLGLAIRAAAARSPGSQPRTVVVRQFLGGRPVARLVLDLDRLRPEG